MYFSRITLRQDVGKSQDFWRLGSEYTIHQAIWELFADGSDSKRDFLYRLDHIGKRPVVYAVSAREPMDQKTIWHIESKIYDPKVKAGARLGFAIRVNPTCKKEDKRHDVVMNAKHTMRAGNPTAIKEISTQEIIFDVCEKWIKERSSKNGFETLQFRVDGYRQVVFYKAKGVKPIRYSTIDITGVLEVREEQIFKNMLFTGLGPEKGFGCGLMLIKKL